MSGYVSGNPDQMLHFATSNLGLSALFANYPFRDLQTNWLMHTQNKCTAKKKIHYQNKHFSEAKCVYPKYLDSHAQVKHVDSEKCDPQAAV